MASINRFWNLERGMVLLFLVICVAMVTSAESFPTDARRFPQLIATMVGLLTAYLLINQYAGWRRNTEPQQREKTKPFLAWTLVLLLSIGAILVTAAFGIGTGMLAFITVLAIVMGLRWHSALLYGVLFSVFVWYVFGTLLRIPLPVGSVIPLF